MAAIGYSVRNGMPDEIAAAAAAAALPAATQADNAMAPREEVLKELPIDPLELGIGFGLVPLVDRRTGGSLVRRVSMIRRQIASELGMVIPPVRIHDEVDLDSHEYVVKVRGIVGRPRHDHGRPSPGYGPGRCGRDAAGNPDHRARLRTAGDLGSREPARTRPRRSDTPSSTASR